jgi:DNA helicase HerA-like ATPase
VFIAGRSGSGKSTLARSLFESYPPPRLLIDPKAMEHTAYAVTFTDPARLPDAPVARFVPRDPTDLDAYDRLYAVVFDAGPRVVWLDEAPDAAPASGAPRNLLRVLKQGRARGIGHIACSQRPVDLAVPVRSESEHVFAFDTQNPADVGALAGMMGLDPSQLRGFFAATPWHGFVWYSARDGVVTLAPPLDL